MFIERLVNEIFEDEYFIELYDKACKLFTGNTFKFKITDLTKKELKDLLRFADILSNSKEINARNKSYRIISLLKDFYKNNNVYIVYSNAILKKLSNFPGLSNSSEVQLPIDREVNHIIDKIRLEIPTGKGYFTPTQYKIYNKMKDSSFFSFSGPTSMGKSFIIKEFVIENFMDYENTKGICIVVPTKSLIKQYVLDFTKSLEEHKLSGINILTTANILDFKSFDSDKFIFILTPERLLNLISLNHNIYLDYLIIDEAHKIFGSDDRALTYYTSIDYSINKFRNVKIILSSPLIQNPGIYGDIYFRKEIETFKTKESPVTQNLFYIDTIEQKLKFYDEKIYTYNVKNISGLDNINNILLKLGNGSSLIYASNYQRVIDKSRELCRYIKENKITLINSIEKQELSKVCNMIKNDIHKDYFLIDCLRYGVAFHFGKLPVTIREQIEELFKKGIIKYLFCTNTLLEGVNMPAKNIFILNDKVGNRNISSIDFWNLAGRAGRLGKEFYGNIFCIKENNKTWKRENLFTDKEKIKIKNILGENLNKNKDYIVDAINDNEIKENIKKNDKYINYISNIIQIDYLNKEKTSLIEYVENIDNKMYESCNKVVNNVDLDILNSSKNIDIKLQNSVYMKLDESEMPKDITYKSCLFMLNRLFDIYRWDIKEPKLKYRGGMRYYALLMTKWINDTPLSKIIMDSIQYSHENECDIYNGYNKLGIFNKNNKVHINALINNIIDDIENVLKFDLEKYFNNYYLLLESKYSEKNVGINWSPYLEFGTRNNKNIILQNVGFSRYTSSMLLKRYKSYLDFEGKGFVEIKKSILDTDVVDNLSLYNELKRWFG